MHISISYIFIAMYCFHSIYVSTYIRKGTKITAKKLSLINTNMDSITNNFLNGMHFATKRWKPNTDTENTLYILDGTAMLYKAHFSFVGMQKYNSTEDEALAFAAYQNALTTMSINFAKFIVDVNPKFLVVAFDHGKRTFRNDLYEDYKVTRQKVRNELYIYNKQKEFIIYLIPGM